MLGLRKSQLDNTNQGQCRSGGQHPTLDRLTDETDEPPDMADLLAPIVSSVC